MASKMKLNLAWQMLIGMVLGVLVGALVDSSFAQTYLQPLGTLFIRLIRMVVVPLVLATLIAGTAAISDTAKLGRVALRVIVIYLITTAFAVAIGLCFALLIQPGTGLTLSTEGLTAKEVVPPKLIDVLLNIVPINPVEGMTKANMLQIIFFAVIFGFGLAGLGEKGKPVIQFFEIFGNAMIRVTGLVMRFAPIGVFGLMAFSVARHGLSVLLPLIMLILTCFLATVTHVVLVNFSVARLIGGVPIVKFLKGVFEPWLIAFTTTSSAAALPANLVAARRLGASKTVSTFSIPLGNTLNMDGTAVYMGVCAIFAAEVYGLDLTLVDQITVVLMGVFASIGTAGVPGAGLIMTTIIFTQVGIPLEAIALIAGVDRILDMMRTSVNVLGDVSVALAVTNLEGDLDKEPYVEGEA